MHRFVTDPNRRALRLYLLGLVCIFAGAWAMAATGSMVPMALAASAGLMLNVPLLRQLVRRANGAGRARR